MKYFINIISYLILFFTAFWNLIKLLEDLHTASVDCIEFEELPCIQAICFAVLYTFRIAGCVVLRFIYSILIVNILSFTINGNLKNSLICTVIAAALGISLWKLGAINMPRFEKERKIRKDGKNDRHILSDVHNHCYNIKTHNGYDASVYLPYKATHK